MLRNIKSVVRPRKKITKSHTKVKSKRVYKDSYINESVSDSLIIAKNTSILKQFDNVHPDVIKLINNSEIIKYKSTAKGLEVLLKNGVNILIESSNTASFISLQGKK